jgi:hypothetical protein
LAAGYFFENLKGPHPLNKKKSFSAAQDKKNVAYPFSWAPAANS